MNDPKAMLGEYADIAAALCDWFESQEIGTGKAIAVMSYMLGVMAANSSGTTNEALERLQKATVASKLICISAMLAK